ncbi:MAG: imidazoleglycerol-phosphate dehydratase HisB [Oscillospiraceae bacterium]|jgi:imidazoleglycerol-phosphate dehydratase|nr:imidazoleglycerol-phosphate dehydratase HisB [Oscillospiraceae bacterium]
MRKAQIERVTKETDIKLSLSLSGGEVLIDTGIGFFDHMLTAFAVHSGFGLEVSCKGDLQVDGHHTVEDIGICLGKAFAEAVGDKSGLARYGSFFIPMDEALVFCSLDISGRAFLAFDVPFPQEKIGDFDSCLVVEFFRAFSQNAGITLHIKSEYGYNSHHIAEAAFKAVAHALRCATEQKYDTVLSSKGSL